MNAMNILIELSAWMVLATVALIAWYSFTGLTGRW